jgi:hypothetical protein
MDAAAIAVGLAGGNILSKPKYWLVKKLPHGIQEEALSFLFCSMCIGFWVGLFGSILADTGWVSRTGLPGPLGFAFAVSISALGLNRLVFGGHHGEE